MSTTNNMTCEFCNKTFSTKSNLVKHQTKTKKCLKMQNKEPEIIHTCAYCKKEFFSKDNYNSHMVRHAVDPLFQSEERNRIQKEKYEEEIEMLKSRHDNEIEMLKSRHNNEIEMLKSKHEIKTADIEREANADYNIHTEKIKTQEETIRQLRNTINVMRQDHTREIELERKTLSKIASKAMDKHTTNNNTYITNNILNINKFTPINFETIRIYKDNLSLEYITSFKKGGEGLAKYLMDYPLKDNVFCTDKSRYKLRYRREDVIISDYKAHNLWESAILNVLYEDITSKIDTVIRNLKNNTDITDDVKIRFEHEYLSLKYDLKTSKESGRITPTQESFMIYLVSNVDTKEELMTKFAPILLQEQSEI